MAIHTYVSNRVHVVISTKERRTSIPEQVQARLWSYIAGIASNADVKACAIGGTVDHIHALLSIPASLSLAKVVQSIKANSSRWLRQEVGLRWFSWQEGYAAFSVSVSHWRPTVAYIQAQAEHHRKKSFNAELMVMLRRTACAGIVSSLAGLTTQK